MSEEETTKTLKSHLNALHDVTYGHWKDALECAARRVGWALPIRKGRDDPKPLREPQYDIREVLHEVQGDNDGPSWVAVVKLNTYRQPVEYATLHAWCDYTGWGCQDGGETMFAETLEQAIEFGLTADDRKRMGLSLPNDPHEPNSWDELP